MLITFKSAAGGDVMMFDENAKQMLGLLGKDPHAEKGIITVDQLRGAISGLKAAIDADKARRARQADEATEDDSGGESARGVNLVQRALPLLGLLERALADEVPVTWGV